MQHTQRVYVLSYDYVCTYARDHVYFVVCYPTRGWLRLVGSLKLQVSFAKEPYIRDYILQKDL